MTSRSGTCVSEPLKTKMFVENSINTTPTTDRQLHTVSQFSRTMQSKGNYYPIFKWENGLKKVQDLA